MSNLNSTSLPIPGRSKPRNLAQAVVEHITESIRNDSLKTGEKLPTESEIMQIYGVSRTVVREAISHLKAAGFVETRHGIGTFVLPPPKTGMGLPHESMVTIRDVLDILEIRISLETEAAWHAATRRSEEQIQALAEVLRVMQTAQENQQNSVDADVQFHLLIAQATGNAYFVDLLSQLGRTIIPRARINTALLAEGEPQSYLQRVRHEHEDIYQAILRKDPEAARAAMRTHLSHSRERLRRAQELLEPEVGSEKANAAQS
ncbi:FadR family transcriptional regulator [Undibacterium sp. LX40W]|uniref:FadR family transcriptional regulator n=1 Tax=Undibacterium nitidum TaxID=2762298 RepID=A0A923HQE7_9BURK|nr:MULTISPECIES: FadR/GntR family transcriptional regulator [Undibacterium]MBC3883272.1 FadR family transcriptional regulator [Undibacterium nitidum]MBC3893581.1 FadR family transcriptional regulator [Undibacterium sp. LX40W]